MSNGEAMLVPLVGSHFHPPAATLLAHLPSGFALALRAEPDNPYDPNAVQVVLRPSDLASDSRVNMERLDAELPNQGMTLEQLMSAGDAEGVVLGHLAASGGRPLAKLREAEQMPQLVGNGEVLAAFGDLSDAGAELRFAPSGASLIAIRWMEAPPK